MEMAIKFAVALLAILAALIVDSYLGVSGFLNTGGVAPAR